MTSTIIRAAYGLEIQYANDPYVIKAEKVMAIVKANTPTPPLATIYLKYVLVHSVLLLY